MAVPLSTIIGNPVSGAILNLDGALGLPGWQWLFTVETVHAVIMAFFVWFYLTEMRSARHLPRHCHLFRRIR